MKKLHSSVLRIVPFTLLVISFTSISSGWAARLKSPQALKFSEQQLTEIIRIARAIQSVHPKLDEGKYLEYASGIFRASRKYQVDPFVLIAIAQQESTFRERLPEGSAGERGICQIRKMWLQQPSFISEFSEQTIGDLERPAKNFMFAAWILKQLKRTAPKGALPFWSYYNARKFENRFKYYLRVNRNIATLRKHQMLTEELTLNTSIAPEPQIKLAMPLINTGVIEESKVPTPSQWVPNTITKIKIQSKKLRRLKRASRLPTARSNRPASAPSYVRTTFTLPRNSAEVVSE